MQMFARVRRCLFLAAILVVQSALAATAANVVVLKVQLIDKIDSESARTGQGISARLINDLRDGPYLLAPKGSLVEGQITQVEKSRALLHAQLSRKRFMHAGGGIGLHFDRIVVPNGPPICISADATRALADEEGKAPTLNANKNGAIEQTRRKDMKAKAGRSALGLAAFAGAPFTPVIGGIAGSLKPSAVLGEAQTESAGHHRRMKGMATGFVAGLPGGFLINDSVIKGSKLTLTPGTNLELEWRR